MLWEFCCSATIFGVSAKSMQCSYDSRGNSVPTVLMLMQQRLYEQGGLQVYLLISNKKCVTIICFAS